ncbi:10230_t:CDS:1, partial [Acaulospora colombiana]
VVGIKFGRERGGAIFGKGYGERWRFKRGESRDGGLVVVIHKGWGNRTSETEDSSYRVDSRGC